MTIFAKSVTPAQKAWLVMYEETTGFEPMHQEELDSGAMTFQEVRRSNIGWYDDHTTDIFLKVSSSAKGLTRTDLGLD